MKSLKEYLTQAQENIQIAILLMKNDAIDHRFKELVDQLRIDCRYILSHDFKKIEIKEKHLTAHKVKEKND